MSPTIDVPPAVAANRQAGASRTRPRRGARRPSPPVLLATLAAFALRLHDLGLQSLWYDEGVSAAMTLRRLGEIPAAAAGDVHPPLYYLALHLWAIVAGRGEWSLRLFSALAATLTVPLVARVGARLISPATGAAAAWFLATLPLHIYYGQEARMYALATLLATATAAAAAEIATRARAATSDAAGSVDMPEAGSLRPQQIDARGGGAARDGSARLPEVVAHRAARGWSPAPIQPGPLLEIARVTAAWVGERLRGAQAVRHQRRRRAGINPRAESAKPAEAGPARGPAPGGGFVGSARGFTPGRPGCTHGPPHLGRVRQPLDRADDYFHNLPSSAEVRTSQPASAGFATSARGITPGQPEAGATQRTRDVATGQPHDASPAADAMGPTGRLAAGRRVTAALWATYGLLGLATALTQYVAGVAVAAVGLWLVLVAPRRLWRGWLVVHAGMLAVFLLWLTRVSWAALDARRQPGSLDPLAAPALALRQLAFGLFWSPPAWLWPTLLGLLAVGSLLCLLDRRRWLPVLWLWLPVAALAAASLERSAFQIRFLLPTAPALALVLGVACAAPALWLRRLSVRAAPARLGTAAFTAVLTAGLIWTWSPAVDRLWRDPAAQRDDYRGLAAYITARAAPDDAIVLSAPGQIEIFGYYYRGAQPVVPLPTPGRTRAEETESTLAALARAHPRLWVVYWAEREADPSGAVSTWLDRHTWKAFDRWFGGPRLALYETGDDAPTRSVDARFGDVIALEAAGIGRSSVPSGGVVPVTLRWRALAPLAMRYTVFAQLLDGQELLVGQRDAEPVAGQRPTTTWQPGEVIEDRLGVPVVEGTPAGSYTLIVGLYDAATGERLAVRAADGAPLGDHIAAATVRIEPPAADAPNPVPPRRLDAAIGELELVGWSLGIVGEDGERDVLPREETARLALYWAARTNPPGELHSSVEVVDAAGRVTLRLDSRPGGAAYPPTVWTTGSVVREQQRLPVGGLAPGDYRLRLRGEGGEVAELGSFEVR